MNSELFRLRAGDYGLDDWRRKAADAVIIAALILHFPLVVAILLDYAIETTGLLKSIIAVAYAALGILAALRPVSHRVRVWCLLAGIELLAFIVIAGFPQGPLSRALPIIVPVLAIGLIGIKAGRIAAVMSALVQMFAPLLHFLPGFSLAFSAKTLPDSTGPGFIWFQSLGLTVEMLAIIVLLERFYWFLMNALEARSRTARELEEEMRERRQLELEINRIGDKERRSLGYEVHDGICQQLTGAMLRCGSLQRRVGRGSALSGEDISVLKSLLAETLEEARSVARDLSPLEGDPDSLVTGLRLLAKRNQSISGIPCEFHASGDVRMPEPATSHHLYRIAQEALSNAIRHARATKISVILQGSDSKLILRVIDDGAGMKTGTQAEGMGLRTMDHRARVIDGELTVESSPGTGTSVTCRVLRPQKDHPIAKTHLQGH